MYKIMDHIAELFPDSQHQRIFLVGGAVRDLLLGREHTDIDLVAALSAEEFTANGFRMVESKTTTPIWFRHDTTFGKIEVTPLAYIKDLGNDLRRRDFTVNALALTVSGKIMDPLGGLDDIQKKRLRACTAHTFIDDPLRLFRALRFESDGWQITGDTEELLRCQEWSDDITKIPAERFSREMLKALGAQQPERFFQRMLELRIGGSFLPELFRMPTIPAGPLIHHPEGDLFTHSLQVLQRVTTTTNDPLARFCAFFHDIGKLTTSPALYPKHHGHDLAGFKIAGEFCQRLRLPAHYGKTLSWISRLHGTFNVWDQLRDSTKLRIADQAIKAGIVDILPQVAAADKAGGSEPEEWRAVVAVARLSARELGIDQCHLERIPPAKRPAYILQSRLDRIKVEKTART